VVCIEQHKTPADQGVREQHVRNVMDSGAVESRLWSRLRGGVWGLPADPLPANVSPDGEARPDGARVLARKQGAEATHRR
jgi:hypothetical protein